MMRNNLSTPHDHQSSWKHSHLNRPGTTASTMGAEQRGAGPSSVLPPLLASPSSCTRDGVDAVSDGRSFPPPPPGGDHGTLLLTDSQGNIGRSSNNSAAGPVSVASPSSACCRERITAREHRQRILLTMTRLLDTFQSHLDELFAEHMQRVDANQQRWEQAFPSVSQAEKRKSKTTLMAVTKPPSPPAPPFSLQGPPVLTLPDSIVSSTEFMSLFTNKCDPGTQEFTTFSGKKVCVGKDGVCRDVRKSRKSSFSSLPAATSTARGNQHHVNRPTWRNLKTLSRLVNRKGHYTAPPQTSLNETQGIDIRQKDNRSVDVELINETEASGTDQNLNLLPPTPDEANAVVSCAEEGITLHDTSFSSSSREPPAISPQGTGVFSQELAAQPPPTPPKMGSPAEVAALVNGRQRPATVVANQPAVVQQKHADAIHADIKGRQSADSSNAGPTAQPAAEEDSTPELIAEIAQPTELQAELEPESTDHLTVITPVPPTVHPTAETPASTAKFTAAELDSTTFTLTTADDAASAPMAISTALPLETLPSIPTDISTPSGPPLEPILTPTKVATPVTSTEPQPTVESNAPHPTKPKKKKTRRQEKKKVAVSQSSDELRRPEPLAVRPSPLENRRPTAVFVEKLSEVVADSVENVPDMESEQVLADSAQKAQDMESEQSISLVRLASPRRATIAPIEFHESNEQQSTKGLNSSISSISTPALGPSPGLTTPLTNDLTNKKDQIMSKIQTGILMQSPTLAASFSLTDSLNLSGPFTSPPRQKGGKTKKGIKREVEDREDEDSLELEEEGVEVVPTETPEAMSPTSSPTRKPKNKSKGKSIGVKGKEASSMPVISVNPSPGIGKTPPESPGRQQSQSPGRRRRRGQKEKKNKVNEAFYIDPFPPPPEPLPAVAKLYNHLGSHKRRGGARDEVHQERTLQKDNKKNNKPAPSQQPEKEKEQPVQPGPDQNQQQAEGEAETVENTFFFSRKRVPGESGAGAAAEDDDNGEDIPSTPHVQRLNTADFYDLQGRIRHFERFRKVLTAFEGKTAQYCWQFSTAVGAPPPLEDGIEEEGEKNDGGGANFGDDKGVAAASPMTQPIVEAGSGSTPNDAEASITPEFHVFMSNSTTRLLKLAEKVKSTSLNLEESGKNNLLQVLSAMTGGKTPRVLGAGGSGGGGDSGRTRYNGIELSKVDAERCRDMTTCGKSFLLKAEQENQMIQERLKPFEKSIDYWIKERREQLEKLESEAFLVESDMKHTARQAAQRIYDQDAREQRAQERSIRAEMSASASASTSALMLDFDGDGSSEMMGESSVMSGRGGVGGGLQSSTLISAQQYSGGRRSCGVQISKASRKIDGKLLFDSHVYRRFLAEHGKREATLRTSIQQLKRVGNLIGSVNEVLATKLTCVVCRRVAPPTEVAPFVMYFPCGHTNVCLSCATKTPISVEDMDRQRIQKQVREKHLNISSSSSSSATSPTRSASDAHNALSADSSDIYKQRLGEHIGPDWICPVCTTITAVPPTINSALNAIVGRHLFKSTQSQSVERILTEFDEYVTYIDDENKQILQHIHM